MKPYEGVEWGTLCGDGWDAFSTVATCRSVGFDTRELPEGKVSALQQRVTATAPFGATAMPYPNMTVWFSNAYCPSADTTQYNFLEECSNDFSKFSSTSASCKAHNNDVAVSCKQYVYGIADFEYRLPSVYNGVPSIVRLEVRPNSTEQWGTVYEPEVLTGVATVRSDRIAQAVCLMAGYGREHAAMVPANSEASGPVWLANLNCTDKVTGLPATNATREDCAEARVREPYGLRQGPPRPRHLRQV